MNALGRVMLVLTAFCLVGADCQGIAGNGLPVASYEECSTSYYNSKHRVGFDPPNGYAGPLNPGGFELWFEWDLIGMKGVSSFTLLKFDDEPWTGTLEELGADRAGNLPNLIRSEPYTLSNGRPGWLVIHNNPDGGPSGQGVTFVKILTLRDGYVFAMDAIGSGIDGTNDADALLAVARSFCVE